MKKIVLGLMAVAIMSSFSAQAGKGKKGKSKKAAKKECCDKSKCSTTANCNPTTCPFPVSGCGSK